MSKTVYFICVAVLGELDMAAVTTETTNQEENNSESSNF
jgi:hypothetical protein